MHALQVKETAMNQCRGNNLKWLYIVSTVLYIIGANKEFHTKNVMV